MKYTIWFLLLAGYLTACQSKTKTSANDFDLDLLTRESGWKIDQPLADSLNGQTLGANFKKIEGIASRFKDNSRIKEFTKGISSIMVMAGLELVGRLEQEKKNPSKPDSSSPVSFISVSDNQFRIKNLSKSSPDTVYTLVEVAGQKAVKIGTSAVKDFAGTQYLIFERLNKEHLSIMMGVYYTPNNSQDALGKLTEEERLWKFGRLEFRANQP